MSVLLATLVATSVVNAEPVHDPIDPFDFHRPHLRKFPRKPPPKPPRIPTPEERCDRNKSWTKLVACLKKQGNATVTTLTDLGTARLVSAKSNPTFDSAAVYVYAQKAGRWQRLSGYFTINASTAVLSFERLKNHDGYRLEQGQVYKTTALINDQARIFGMDQTRIPVTMRRKTTSVCRDGHCQTFVTSCEALVEGKARWSFRGTLRILGGTIKLSGDSTYAGQVCAPSPSIMSDGGDLLE